MKGTNTNKIIVAYLKAILEGYKQVTRSDEMITNKYFSI